MSCYVIAHIEVTDRTQYMQYAEAAGAQIEAAGGRVLGAGPAAMLEGEPFPDHNVVLEFPTSEAVVPGTTATATRRRSRSACGRPQPPSSQSFREGSA